MNRQGSGFDGYGLLKRRVLKAGSHSLDGLKACFAHEEAFRVEVFLGAVLAVLACFIAGSLVEWAVLFSTIMLVMIVELLNSAVEATVDRIGEEYHDLAKRAKDIGSAAVFMSMIVFVVVWGAVVLSKIFY